MWRGQALLFSDIPNKRIVRWRRLPEGPELTTFATGMSNGLTLDRQGHVLAAEHDGRRVTRVADDGTRTVLAERFQGKRLNSPNDIVIRSDGSIYFTDPPYAVQPSRPGTVRPAGWWTQPIQGKEQPCHGVYRIAPDGALHLEPFATLETPLGSRGTLAKDTIVLVEAADHGPGNLVRKASLFGQSGHRAAGRAEFGRF